MVPGYFCCIEVSCIFPLKNISISVEDLLVQQKCCQFTLLKKLLLSRTNFYVVLWTGVHNHGRGVDVSNYKVANSE